MLLLVWAASRSSGAHGPPPAEIAIALLNAPADLIAFLMLQGQRSVGSSPSWLAVIWLSGSAQWAIVALVAIWAFGVRTKPG